MAVAEGASSVDDSDDMVLMESSVLVWSMKFSGDRIYIIKCSVELEVGRNKIQDTEDTA